jgi:hypothetical protein
MPVPIRPAIRTQLHAAKLVFLCLRQRAATRTFEAAEIEFHLLLQRSVDKAADLDVLFNSAHPFFFAAPRRKRFNH